MKALVVDDHEAVRVFVERVLRDAGYQTAGARDGVAAQRLVLRAGPPDVVVTDLSMPRMSGHEFARWLAGCAPDVKVLFLTGCLEAADRRAGAAYENWAYLEKPCSARGLLQAVSRLMDRQPDSPITLLESPAL